MGQGGHASQGQEEPPETLLIQPSCRDAIEAALIRRRGEESIGKGRRLVLSAKREGKMGKFKCRDRDGGQAAI